MSLDYYFHVETRRTGVWTEPAGFPRGPHGERFGELTWIHRRSSALGLFFGPDALFPFRRGVPDDRAESALFRFLDGFYDYAEDERRLAWIPYPDLMVDLWDEPSLLLECKVPVGAADLFGDGRQMFPRSALAARGYDERALWDFHDGVRVGAPRDRTQGKGRFELGTVVPEARVPVTFQASVADHLGAEKAAAFRALRAHGADEELRVVSMYC